MAKKTFTLDFQEEYDFLLLGVFCSYRDYRLCYELNKTLDLRLERMDDLELKLEKKGSTGLFPVFHFMNTDGEHFFLISNKGSNGLFVPELKQVDFFVLVKEFSRYTNADDLLKAIGKIEIVSSIIELEPTKLKSADNFLMVEYSEK
jgi:hypothetical protein